LAPPKITNLILSFRLIAVNIHSPETYYVLIMDLPLGAERRFAPSPVCSSSIHNFPPVVINIKDTYKYFEYTFD
jgi:hypothetical protein